MANTTWKEIEKRLDDVEVPSCDNIILKSLEDRVAWLIAAYKGQKIRLNYLYDEIGIFIVQNKVGDILSWVHDKEKLQKFIDSDGNWIE